MTGDSSLNLREPQFHHLKNAYKSNSPFISRYCRKGKSKKRYRKCLGIAVLAFDGKEALSHMSMALKTEGEQPPHLTRGERVLSILVQRLLGAQCCHLQNGSGWVGKATCSDPSLGSVGPCTQGPGGGERGGGPELPAPGSLSPTEPGGNAKVMPFERHKRQCARSPLRCRPPLTSCHVGGKRQRRWSWTEAEGVLIRAAPLGRPPWPETHSESH